MLINKKITTAIATGAILMNAFIPAAFAQGTAVGIIGNGAESSNAVNATQNNASVATQNNNATITNNIDSSASTGGNDANFNTGGNTGISTGGAANSVSVSNTANSNFMNNANPCGCNDGALIQESGNGAFSGNTANLTSNNSNVATQSNDANFTNNVDAKAKTGDNSASDNTGGDNSIFTGPAKNFVDVSNTANKNVMLGGSATGMGAGTTIKIDGNGALSGNTVNDTNNNSAVATQSNSATFFNDVDAKATTGKNDANFNTDGNNAIFTGAATNWVGVANTANQNVMDALDCGCATGDLFKIAANGAFSGSTINATNNDSKVAAQDNAADFSNSVDPHAFTGDNSVSDATGSFWFAGDPNTVMTGQAASQTQVANTSNENVLSSNGMSMGGMNFSWDPAALMGGFGL